ncbi:urease accessory protein UreH [Ammoniphilus sp. 3BR4]|uniref:HoxN/HupN/NixA family nickel/cobalt transporter n=1 Tax=Ammoniphilus sp. 3BR4 TaxID=3158265 RepID=UPI003465C5A4
MGEEGLISILIIGFLLGIKHAIEPDHVIAVSTIASQSKKLSRSSLAGVFWGIGHTATLFVVGMAFIVMKQSLSEKWTMSLEFAVGIMLVYLGVKSIKKNQKYEHSSYGKSMIVGAIHGMAGSAALVVLTMATVETVAQGALYILVFGVGTVAGMLLFTTCIGISLLWAAKNELLNRFAIRSVAVLSTIYGIYYMYDLGVTEGLFELWMR